MGVDDKLIEQLKADYRKATLSPEDRAMLDYVAELTSNPMNMTKEHVDSLKEHGFSESAILDICQITCYYAFVNRLADGLGVELEAHWQENGKSQ